MKRTVFGLLVTLTVTAACSGDDSDTGTAQPTTTVTEKARHGLTAEQASKVIVRVGGRSITVGEFADRLHAQSPYLRARYASPERRREFLENMIRFELLAHAAEAAGHRKDGSVIRVQQDAMVEQMMADLFDEKAIIPEKITDAEIRAHYESHRADFVKPAQVRVRHILVTNENQARQVLDRVQASPDDEAGFFQLAQRLSRDQETASRGGDLHFFSQTEVDGRNDVPTAVRNAAFTLQQPGDIYPNPVKSKAGFHILRLTAKREGYQRTLEDASQIVRNLLWREKRQQAIVRFIDKLRADADVRTDEAALQKVELAATP